MAKLPVPKSRKVGHQTAEVGHETTGGGSPNDPIKHTHNNKRIVTSRRLRPEEERDSVKLENIEATLTRRSEERISKKLKSAKGKKFPSYDEALTMWLVAYRDATDCIPTTGVTTKEWGMFRQVSIKRPDFDVREFFADICNNWDYIGTSTLKFVDDYPELPSLSLVFRMSNYFAEAVASLRGFSGKQETFKKRMIEASTKQRVKENAPTATSERHRGLFLDTELSNLQDTNFALGDYLLAAKKDHADIYIWAGIQTGWIRTMETVPASELDKDRQQIIDFIEAIK